MSSRGRDLIRLSSIIAVAFALGIAFASALDLPRAGVAEQSPRARLALTGRPVATGLDGQALPSFADVAEAVKPSVVFIRSERRTRSPNSMQGMPREFQDFFRQFGQVPQQPRIQQSSGSGFIVSADGYVLTNNHVVADADQVTVKLLDNREFPARVIGRDPATDVAVIKINADHLPAVALGNSDQARVGDWVLAIGNPLEFQFTVTAGIISAKGRNLPGLLDPTQQYSIQDFIQTDAAINPGNSGGPLVNARGEVVGINSAIASQTGFYAGYGFAIPVNLARRVMNDLVATGRVERAVLGVSIGEITPEDAEYVGLRDIRGVVVKDYNGKNSPARAAGLQPGDVIVALNDSTVDHVAQLQQMVAFRRPGEVVRVTAVRHGGERRTYDVRLAAAPTDGEQVASNDSGRDSSTAVATEGKLGIAVEVPSADFVRQARLNEDQRGLVVSDVEEGGPSWGKLVDPDQGPDVITQVNDTRVRSREEFQRALRAIRSGEVVQLRVYNVQLNQSRIVRIRTRS